MSRNCVNQRMRVLGLTGLCIGMVACGGGNELGANAGTMNVRMVDAPGDGYREVNVDVQRIEISTSGGAWIELGRPNRVVNLLALRGGVAAELATGARIASGHYEQLRLVLGTRNSVVLTDGTVEALTVPSGTRSGIKMNVNFEVAAGSTRDVVIDFDAHKSIHLHQTGSGKFMLRPVVRAFDVLATGSVSGRVTHEVGGAVVSGAVVTAQRVDASGRAEVVRTTTTNASGQYTLDLLARGETFFVVVQPSEGEANYAAQASAGVMLELAVATVDLSVRAAVGFGAITGRVTPIAAANEGDFVEVRQQLTAGARSGLFVVRSTNAQLSANGETFAFARVPVGDYEISAIRTAEDIQGNGLIVARANALSLRVLLNVAVTVDLGF